MKMQSLSMIGALALALGACSDSATDAKPAPDAQTNPAANAPAKPAAQPALPQVPTLEALDARAEQEITSEQADAHFEKLKQEIEADAP